eukprot:CAMPEP_0202899966 /NCGR_PEP_ID=MMETSP1392-20130828/9354_1 /ASSEMBLY_ACC=CAM_ASM_000868 /TAXON_ID=225041 /ORGANISM="Chlamydomonas chlamydogama, Strain SAG 11-48b" /LENGTH=209 /DNA_ID=CAMNT_0049586271 /DNA_START=80 /DNA_END=709 /DNA_ORIENTATION=-
MALRQLGRSLTALVSRSQTQNLAASFSVSGQLTRGYGAGAHHDDHHDDHEEKGPVETPTVFDKLVTLNVADLHGRKHVVRGIVGKSLSQALVEAGFPETYFFPTMGFYTQHQNDAHVYIPKEHWDKMPCYEEDSDEADAIKRMFKDIVQEYAKETSFFASFITLSHDMNGMNLGFGPIKPWILHTNRAFSGVHDSPISQFAKPTEEIFS